MGHGYEIIALAAQPPEQKHAKCINADQKKTGCQVPFTNATRGPEMISPNSFCVFIFTKAHRYELRPAIPVQPSEPKCENNMIYYSETVEFDTKF